MGIAIKLAALALREAAGGAAEAVGFKVGGAAAERVIDFLVDRFTDQSQRLAEALLRANDRAWKALEIALAGESFWERCQVALSRGEDQAFRRQVRSFLDITPLAGLPSHGPEFRQQCLRELRAARKAGLLSGGALALDELAREAGAFARFSDPAALLEAEHQAVAGLGEDFRTAGHAALAQLLALRPAQGVSLLVVAARYFFRREMETDQQLFQGMAWAQLERLAKEQESGFTSLAVALATQGQRLEDLLGDVRVVVVETHGAVLRIEEEMQRHGKQVQDLGAAVLRLLEEHQLQRRTLQARDSLSMRNEGERQEVKQLAGRYRSLPEEERRQLPGLLNGLGKLEVLAGDFDAAQRDFETAARLAPAPGARAEAHYHAYQAALERRDWDAALRKLRAAVADDPGRFTPFPIDKYEPQRILGAGGFGVAFQCRHAYMNAPVVVKALLREGLDQSVDKVFAEAQLLRQLDHPAVIRMTDCGYVDAGQARPYLVMDFFDGVTLEEHVRSHGPLAPADFLHVTRQIASGLAAAHGKGILHRDVKPANLLVRREADFWQVCLIDFGLAQRAQTLAGGSASSLRNTIVGGSIAGTIDYAAPEQMGKLPGVAVGPAADVYGFGRMCCYALFGTPHPLPKHWRTADPALVDLLESCLAETPEARPSCFAAVLSALDAIQVPTSGRSTLGPAGAPTIRASAPMALPMKDEPPIAEAWTGPVPVIVPRRRLPRARLAAGAGAALVLLLVILWQLLRTTPTPPQALANATTSKREPDAETSVPFEPKADPGGWGVLFRSADPAIWNDDVRKGPEHFAQAVDTASGDLRYLRLTNVSTNDYVILDMTKDRLAKQSEDGRYGWDGSNIIHTSARHLGITNAIWPSGQNGDITVSGVVNLRGWGFGNAVGTEGQRYSWDGKAIPRTVFEIAVKATPLTAEEAKKLLKVGKPRVATGPGPGDKPPWKVIFRASDPSIWNDDICGGPEHYACAVDTVPNDVAYLRLTNLSTKDHVIIDMTKDRLAKRTDDGRYGWDGLNVLHSGAHHLGVHNLIWPLAQNGDICVTGGPHLRGWGFGNGAFSPEGQRYSWDGKPIQRTVFEIAVKSKPLVDGEASKLLKVGNPRVAVGPAPEQKLPWRVIFRSADPSIWNDDIRKGPDDFACALETLPTEIRYLRLINVGIKDYVIIDMTRDRLVKQTDDGRYGWDGKNIFHSDAHHLGITNAIWPSGQAGDITIGGNNRRGWGFGNGRSTGQRFSWAGQAIDRTVFEIAVSSTALTEEETKKLLKTGKLRVASGTAPEQKPPWKVIFRSADPSIWNDDVCRGPDDFASALETVIDDMRYLRLTNTGAQDYVILPITKDKLRKRGDDGKYGWEGSNEYNSEAHHLGIYRRSWTTPGGTICISASPHCRGWGFGHVAFAAKDQAYSWAGKKIEKTVFEIAVKAEELTEDEIKQLLILGDARE